MWADQCGATGVNSFLGYSYDQTHCTANDYSGMLWSSTCSAYTGGESGYAAQQTTASVDPTSITTTAFSVNPKTGAAWSYADTGCMPCRIEDWTWSDNGPDSSCGMNATELQTCREYMANGNGTFCDACYLHAVSMGWDACDLAYDDTPGDWFRNLAECAQENSGCVTCDASYCTVGQFYDDNLCMNEFSGCTSCTYPLEKLGSSTRMSSYSCGVDEYISGLCTGANTADNPSAYCELCTVHGDSAKHSEAGTCTGTNMYIANRCTGQANNTQEQAQCISCGSCGAGNYRTVSCTGGDNIMQCAECGVTGGAGGTQQGGATYFCGLGYYRTGSPCDGSSDTDTQTCTMCTQGTQFTRTCQESSVCDGYGSTDTQDESSLSTCTPI